MPCYHSTNAKLGVKFVACVRWVGLCGRCFYSIGCTTATVFCLQLLVSTSAFYYL